MMIGLTTLATNSTTWGKIDFFISFKNISPPASFPRRVQLFHSNSSELCSAMCILDYLSQIHSKYFTWTSSSAEKTSSKSLIFLLLISTLSLSTILAGSFSGPFFPRSSTLRSLTPMSQCECYINIIATTFTAFPWWLTSLSSTCRLSCTENNFFLQHQPTLYVCNKTSRNGMKRLKTSQMSTILM